MERLLQEFERRITDNTGTIYRVFLYGRSRPADTWVGWLVFERISDGTRFSTDVETTQPNAQAVVYWATGLTDAYFDGALARAVRPRKIVSPLPVIPAPIVGNTGDSYTQRRRLANLERAVLACFTRHRAKRLPTLTVFDELPNAHADGVRAFEDLEKQGGLLIRRTEEGSDWVFLTQSGAIAAGVADTVAAGDVDREPPPLP